MDRSDQSAFAATAVLVAIIVIGFYVSFAFPPF
jgi:hypothetical protein